MRVLVLKFVTPNSNYRLSKFIVTTLAYIYTVYSYNVVIIIIQFGADVVSCARDPTTDAVSAWDGWNSQSRPRASVVDSIQDVRLFSGSYMNNRISCS